MTHHTDILGNRPPNKLRVLPESEADFVRDENWQGKEFLRIERSASGGGNYRLRGAALERFDRRVKVKQLHAQGLKETDIAAAVGCSQTCVVMDLKLAGLK